MTLKQLIELAPSLIRYNLRIIFAGKFIWFFLAALLFFGFFIFQSAWNREDMNEGLIYKLLFFPSLLLIFYPAVFGIQNDEENRILEILFGIPDYKFKVWGVRLLIIYIAIYFILVLFGYLATWLLYPVNPFTMSLQLMFPIFFVGNLAFMLSTITRSGNGTAVLVIMLGIGFLFMGGMMQNSFTDIYINPYTIPRDFHPSIWQNTLLKSRIFLFAGAVIWFMIGLLNLQKREKFI